jgi:hypothetical protein
MSRVMDACDARDSDLQSSPPIKLVYVTNPSIH